MAGTCIINTCSKTVHCRELCQMHYRRWLRHGSTEFVTTGREHHRFHGFTLYSTHGIVYATAERDRIAAMPVVTNVAIYDALHATQDARDAARSAADAARYPWLCVEQQMVAD